MQVSPELNVNQLLQMIDLEIMGIHIDLRAVDPVPRNFSYSVSVKMPLTFHEATRSCKR